MEAYGAWLRGDLAGAVPGALLEFELTRQMRWSWEQLEHTPVGIRRLWSGFLAQRAEVEAEVRYDASLTPEQHWANAQREIDAARARLELVEGASA